jgi:hypothetical protein
MTILSNRRLPRLFGLVAVLALAQASGGTVAGGQNATERLWLAGRYDRAHLIVYFEAVRFDGSFPTDAESMAPPIADFFSHPAAL